MKGTQLTTDDISKLQKKARKKAKEIFNGAFPIPVRTVARGGDGMDELVLTFTPEDIIPFSGQSNKWPAMAQKVEDAFAKHGLKANVDEFVWLKSGKLKTKPKLLLDVDVVKKLEALYFAVQAKECFGRNNKMPHGSLAAVKKVNSF